MIADIFLISGVMTMRVSLGPMMLGLGRLLVGFGVGIEMNVAPIFLAECSRIPIRQLIVQTFFFQVFIGLILSYCSGLVFPGKLFYMFGFEMDHEILQFLILMFSQKEPAIFLARCGIIKLAEKSLVTLYT